MNKKCKCLLWVAQVYILVLVFASFYFNVLLFTQPANKSSLDSEKQPETQRTKNGEGWTITEEGESGKETKFNIIIPKLNKNGKENYQVIP